MLPQRLAADESVVGRRLRRPLQQGKPVLRSDLDPVYVIERGAVVTAEVDVGRAHLSAPAVAQTRAKTGQKVILRNPGSQRSFTGRAQQDGSVRVDQPKPEAAGAKGLR